MRKKNKSKKTRKSKWPKVNRSSYGTVIKRLETLKENGQQDCLLYKQLLQRVAVFEEKAFNEIK